MPAPNKDWVNQLVSEHLAKAGPLAAAPEPTAAEIAEMEAEFAELEAGYARCTGNHDPSFLGDDGCEFCGFYAK